MLNKIPLLVIFLIIIFLVTSLMTFISMEKAVTSERIEPKPQGSTAGGVVSISILNPDYEKEGRDNEADK